jgi:hypothetical protein
MRPARNSKIEWSGLTNSRQPKHIMAVSNDNGATYALASNRAVMLDRQTPDTLVIAPVTVGAYSQDANADYEGTAVQFRKNWLYYR